MASARDRLRELAEAERERLRRAASSGDRKARRALEDLGETPPALRHWSEDDEGEGV
jgi:hypothetical protein